MYIYVLDIYWTIRIENETEILIFSSKIKYSLI